MNRCNDPTCPLNRQAVPHTNHELIESKPVTNPCDDPRCGLNRIGLRHNVHDHMDIDGEPKQEQLGDEDTVQDGYNDNGNGGGDDDDLGYNDNDGDDDDIGYADLLDRLGRHTHSGNRLYEEQVISEETKQARQKIEQEAREEIKKQAKNKSNSQDKISAKSSIPSRSNDDLVVPSINQILHTADPYKIFNVTQDVTCAQIKARFKKLSKSYNASRGSANRTRKEQRLLTQAQSKINLAYDFLSKRHCS